MDLLPLSLTDAPLGDKTALAALRASEERFRATFEQAALGIAHIGLDGLMLRANWRLCQMNGYRREELVGLHARDLMDEESRHGSQEDLRRLVDGEVASYTAERRFVRRSGEVYPVRLSVSLVRGDQSEPYLISFIEDMSQHAADQRRIQEQALQLQVLNALLEDRIRERTQQLQESNDELRTFAYSLAHDLRAPLAAIDGFSGELEHRLGRRLDDRSRHYLGRVRSAAGQMSDLTDAMLSLTHLSQAPLLRQSVDLSAAAQAWLHRTREQYPGRQVDVRIASTPRAEGDVRLLADMLENLLGNAWKFTSGREGARIEFGARESKDGNVEYFVRDNGVGFDAAYADKLFTPFQRLHGAAEFPGTGIGLAIVRKIVNRHGGRVWAESGEGEGAAFFFTLGEVAG